ncbi:C-terminal peptidase prc [Sphingomonas kyeonggiensis]|uniref:C-terminal peptidase prc n=1 Tax=Sphingomonas kyeonggiensis TaxID=1268553 RepID=A0A7W7K127_9SPHN|nr:S41 family peptidase [Sphingomonas kyeonggiensis]MBB4838753.1 C-terminal peptidase prc [Sphingomonas kyeonggiensis]
MIRKHFWGALVVASLCASSPIQAQSSEDTFARFRYVFALIRDNYVEPLDMAPLAGAAIDMIRGKAPLDEEAWSRCMGERSSLGSDEVAKAMRCAGFDQPGSEADKIMDAAIEAMIAKLDTHSRWVTFTAPAKLLGQPAARASTGLTLRESNRHYTVLATGFTSAAERAGIRKGDELIAIDGTVTAELSFDDVIQKLRGPEGSPTTLTMRRSDGSTADFPLNRTIVDRIDTELQIERRGSVLIVRLSGLPSGATQGVSSALSQNGDVSALVVDLQDNQGGLLSEAVALADLFLDKGVIVTLKGRDKRDVETYRAVKKQLVQGIPILVLVNENTAAGAEILAAALQDNRRATVFGRSTQGAGSVQSIIPVGSQRALRLTTSHEYRADGRKLSEAPVIPNCSSNLDTSTLLNRSVVIAATDPGSCLVN